MIRTCALEERQHNATIQQRAVEAEKQKLQHLEDMRALCVPDHFKVEMKAADGLLQVECMSAKTGITRLVYVEAPTP
jgi:hypothetical protein